MRLRPARPCESCGAPTASAAGLCLACREPPDGYVCAICGVLRTRGVNPAPSRFGICRATAPCRAAYHRALRAEQAAEAAEAGDRPRCSLCGGPLVAHSVSGICTRNPECKRAAKAAEVRRRDQRKREAAGPGPTELARREAEKRDAVIRQLRAKGWKQADIASEVGLSIIRVSQVLRGTNA